MLAKTKIIATVGPASDSPETLSALVDAGVRIFRLNFSHGDASKFVDIIKNIRAIEKRIGLPITIMQDLSGPKIRIGALEEGSITFRKGDHALLGISKPAGATLPFIPFDHQPVMNAMAVGDRLVLADGTLQFIVKESPAPHLFVLEAGNNGIVTSRKGLALPGKSVAVPALTDKDRKDLKDGLELGIDAVALSFVQTGKDILDAKEIIKASGRDVPVVAKLERQNAVNNLDEILEAVDIVMVARGDLGIECPLPLLPAMQKRIIRACNRASKPVIVATQMLLSMVNNPSPTRAETTDVANAVLDGADCVMLSEETAMGNYPVEAVRFMGEIAVQAEILLAENPLSENKAIRCDTDSHDVTCFLSYSACLLAEKIKAKALVTHSVTGRSARTNASQRPSQPVYTVSRYPATLHSLNFSWGVIPCAMAGENFGHLEAAEKFIENSPFFDKGDVVVITAGQVRSGCPITDLTETVGTNVVKVFTK